MKVLGAIQPSYLAWIPFFRRMMMSDIFIYLDDVEYSKNSFHNRNRIKSKDGSLLLTVPVNYTGHSRTVISQISLATNVAWARKHLRSIEMCYAKAEYFNAVMDGLAPIYNRQWKTLGDLNVTLLEFFRKFLGVTTPCYRSSTLPVAEYNGNEKLVELCRNFGADHFIVKPHTEDYHPPLFFKEHGIDFKMFVYQDVPYKQLHEGYIPGLSVLDLMMNRGPEGLKKLQ